MCVSYPGLPTLQWDLQQQEGFAEAVTDLYSKAIKEREWSQKVERQMVELSKQVSLLEQDCQVREIALTWYHGFRDQYKGQTRKQRLAHFGAIQR